MRSYAINLIKQRICVINDFRNTTAVLDKLTSPEIEIANMWIVSGPRPDYTSHEHSIGVFLNYKKVLDTKSKTDAFKKIQELVTSPEELEIFKEAIYGSVILL
jgi:hypothetical protein